MKEQAIRKQALQIARRLKSDDVTQEEVAKALGVSQSQISRVLAGHIKRPTRLFLDLCIYAEGRLKKLPRSRICANDELMGALMEVWDGTPQHARLLATVIRSLGVFSRRNSDL